MNCRPNQLALVVRSDGTPLGLQMLGRPCRVMTLYRRGSTDFWLVEEPIRVKVTQRSWLFWRKERWATVIGIADRVLMPIEPPPGLDTTTDQPAERPKEVA